MDVPFETVVNGTNVAAGAAIFFLAKFHRGDTCYDENRGINISEGNGFSSRIIDRFPAYRNISSSVDHFLEGVGYILGLGGIVGITFQALDIALAVDIEGATSYSLMMPYYCSSMGAVTKKALWEVGTFIRRKETYDLTDIMQVTADVASVATPLYVLSQIVK